MNEIAKTCVKAGAVWTALLVGVTIASIIKPVPGQVGNDGPLTAGQALLLVNAAHALILSWLASRMAGPVWRKALLLFTIMYGAGTLLSLIEAHYFSAFVKMPVGWTGSVAFVDGVKAAAGAGMAALLWRGGAAEPIPAAVVPLRLAAISILYVFVYHFAGFMIAWQSEAVQQFYGDGLQIDLLELSMLQVVRGLLWGFLALAIVQSTSGSTLQRAAMTGLAFFGFMALPLLFPSAIMPWPVRAAHLIEVSSSNFLFGVAAAAILLRRRPSAYEAAPAH